MTLLLGIDLETTGLNPETDHIIEVGCVLWDTSSQTPIKMNSSLIELESTLPAEITSLTGITDEQLKNAPHKMEAFKELCEYLREADYLVAHNAQFERSFLREQQWSRSEESKPWIDTKTDIPYKPGKGNGSLSEIAMCHGVFNPIPHRALTDTLAMMQVLAQYDFAEVERYAKAETVTLIASLSYDPTGTKQRAIRALGFYWDAPTKQWRKPCKDFLVEEQIYAGAQAGFDIFREIKLLDSELPF